MLSVVTGSGPRDPRLDVLIQQQLRAILTRGVEGARRSTFALVLFARALGLDWVATRRFG
jgi:hypothetical protein